MPFKILSETATADIAFEASGKSLNEVFRQACLATCSVMVDIKTVKPITKLAFSKENKTLEGLLYDVLDELVFLKDSENLLFSKCKVTVKQGKPNQAVFSALGEQINPKTMSLGNDIKAVTWHLFSLKKLKSGWVARILLDV